jgi:Protein of unknown function (DUF1761)
MLSWHYLWAILAAGVSSSFTDWFFMGFLFHEKYLTYPEIWWRPKGGEGETSAIAISSVVSLLTPLCLVALFAHFHISSYAGAINAALLVWGASAVPLLITNALFIKFHPLTVAAHALGWFAKFLIAGLATVLFLK